MIERLQSDALAGQHLAEKHMLVLAEELSVRVDAPHQHVAIVIRLRNPLRIRARRCAVDRIGRPLAKRFVRTLFVVFAAEAVEGLLLATPVGCRGCGRLCLQRPVHPFVASVLLRVAWFSSPMATSSSPGSWSSRSAAFCQART